LRGFCEFFRNSANLDPFIHILFFNRSARCILNPVCKNPELGNPQFQQCVAEINAVFIDCNVNCGTDTVCVDRCIEIFKENRKDCPCMENCQMGCPCDGRFKCEPYITAMCQGHSSSFIDFSYTISASRHNKPYLTSYQVQTVKFLLHRVPHSKNYPGQEKTAGHGRG
jgi:hypothetical protein